jgi:Fe-S oxidoreductase
MKSSIRPVAPSPRHPVFVSVFTGCVMKGLFKHANEATNRVLAVNGCELNDVETQVCCGALHAHAGDLEMARRLARRNIDAFEEFLAADRSATIIINAAGARVFNANCRISHIVELLDESYRRAGFYDWDSTQADTDEDVVISGHATSG